MIIPALILMFMSVVFGSEMPEYVIRYSPVVHLYSEERYLPYDIKEYLTHFQLKTSKNHNVTDTWTSIAELTGIERTFELKSGKSSRLFLTALEDFSTNPEWITGKDNVPEIDSGKIGDAPAVLIVVDRGDGWVDAFWFYFYSFNLGPFVMGGGPYGNHIGDWEHTLTRFKDGVPQLVWMSAHGGGTAYEFSALEKLDYSQRPVLFSARGTHAMYASVGQHSHDIPYHMLSDFTDRGPLWDPAQNYLAYTYNGTAESLKFSNGSEPGREETYGDWLLFSGHWGDKKLPSEDARQKYHPFEWRIIDGPLGPLQKNLLRENPCQRSKWWNVAKTCRIRHQLQMGEGIESEGGQCGRMMDKIRPIWLQLIINVIVNGGFGCFMIDRIWG